MRISPGVPLNTDLVVSTAGAANGAQIINNGADQDICSLNLGTRQAGEVITVTCATFSYNGAAAPITRNLALIKSAGTAVVVFSRGNTLFRYSTSQATFARTPFQETVEVTVTTGGTLTLTLQLKAVGFVNQYVLDAGDGSISASVRRGQ